MSDPIVRIAARGDGVSASGKHVAFAVPGDMLEGDGSLIEGPGHRVPPCRHFPECGGCQLQHLTDAAYADYCTSRVAGALAQHGIETELRPAHLSPPRSRRRANLRARRTNRFHELGFNERNSQRIIDMKERHILHPSLFALIDPLRRLLMGMMGPQGNSDIQLTLVDQGAEVIIRNVSPRGIEAAENLATFAERHGLARLSIDEGFGAEARYEPSPVTITLGGVAVGFPPGAFLQATADGEAALIDAVREAVGGAQRPLDLFAGLGTFALSQSGQVTAAEASRDSILSLLTAARGSGRAVTAEHRDLYRRPYDEKELAMFDAVVLDPPRAGAVEQVKALAASTVPRIAYVSCNPATFARDAEMLVGGGYGLEWARPVGQFRWSTHVELAAFFVRTSR